jgi:OOP family OmpA-OmpF porin
MNKFQVGLMVILASFSSATFAEGNFYGGIDVGQSTVKDICTGLSAGAICSDTATAVRASFGFQVNPSLGLEASYGDYGTINANEVYLGTPISYSGSASGFQFSAVGSLPVSESFALTGKLGIALTEGKESASAPSIRYAVSTSASNTTVAYGVGMRYNINKTVAVRAQYEDLGDIKVSSTGTGSKLTILSFGATFSF